MRKELLSIFSLVLVLALSGCGSKTQNQERMANQNQAGNAGSSIISSIKDAMASGKTMRCTYQMQAKNGGPESAVYIKGNQYRYENQIQNRKMVGIFDGDTMWSWGEGDKNGFKMTKECTQELANQNQNGQPEAVAEPGDEAFKDALDVKCEPADNVDFSVPSDVTFTDQCEMLKGLSNQTQEMMKKYQGQMPQAAGGAQ